METYHWSYVCECSRDDCHENISDEDYEWFARNYDINRFNCRSIRCKFSHEGKIAYIPDGRKVVVLYKDAFGPLHCECGEMCGCIIPAEVAETYRSKYSDMGYTLRHPACQTNINHADVIEINDDIIVYDEGLQLREINLRMMGKAKLNIPDMSAINQ